MRFGESFAPFGDAAHIVLDGIDIILNSTRAQSFDPSLFSVMGIDPPRKKILVIKSTNHFYASFSHDRVGDPLLLGGNALSEQSGDARPIAGAPKDIWPIVADPHGQNAGAA